MDSFTLSQPGCYTKDPKVDLLPITSFKECTPDSSDSESTSEERTTIKVNGKSIIDINSCYEEPMAEDPVVIVGMACRLPGGVSSPHDLWTMLKQQRSGTCRVPSERFNIDGFYHPEGDRAGVMNSLGGYFLQEDVRQFENTFFGINNLEATYMDPQQRKLLEVVYEALENSGTTLVDVAGANVGVYVGNFTVDFLTMQAREPDYAHRYSATGSGTAILSNRISYVFDLRGPSLTIDTACSSSIYCLHAAVAAINNGECDSALVAGANLVTAPEQHMGTSKGGVLSATSTCHTFDASADGYGRAEGVGALYLKRLSAAIRDGDDIRAVVRGTAVNANGKTSGITQPSITMQAEAIRKCYRNAGLDPKDTPYVECHGTGTAVGDPMEVEALSQVFSRPDRLPLLLGANKTNLGHSEAASGISAVIKVALAFKHKVLPATIGVTKLNPKLHLEEWNMQVVTKPMDWPSHIHRASLNSFGFGGANAHVILESIDSYLPLYQQTRIHKLKTNPTQFRVLPFSAASDISLQAQVCGIAQRLSDGEDYAFEDLCHTLANRRSRLSHKGYVLTSEALNKGDFTCGKIVTPEKAIPCLPIALVFTGQGAQWAQMGKELIEQSAIFRGTIHELDSILAALPEAPSWSLYDTIIEPSSTSSVNKVTHSQPLCTAIQIGLIRMLGSWHVGATAVVGHSSGEIAAAYTSGLLSAAQAIVIAYYRGYVVGNASSRGVMLAAGTSYEVAEQLIEDLGLQKEVGVACVNSPESVTISGSASGIDLIIAQLKKRNLFARQLVTGERAYHSHMMREIGANYERLMARTLPTVSGPLPEHTAVTQHIKWYSSVAKHGENLTTFSRIAGSRILPRYWRDNLESPVQFNAAVKNILATGNYHFVEIGPHSALQLPLKQICAASSLSEQQFAYSSTLLRGKDSNECLKRLAGELYLHGHEVDFLSVNETGISKENQHIARLADLPPYKWNYSELLWAEPRSSVELRKREYVRHELLGAKSLAGNGIEHSWRNILKLHEIPWLGDHKLESQIVFPATGYLAMAMEAILQLKHIANRPDLKSMFTFRNVNIMAALVVRMNEDDTEICTTMHASKLSTASVSDIWFDFSISSIRSGTPTQHCIGSINIELVPSIIPTTVNVDASNYQTWTMEKWYAQLESEGLCFGPHFQSLTSMQTDKERKRPDALSTTRLKQRVKKDLSASYDGTFYPVHPITLDSCLQAAIFGETRGVMSNVRVWLPVFITECRITPPSDDQIGAEAYIHSTAWSTGPNTKRTNITLQDKTGNVVVSISNARLHLYTGKTIDEEEGNTSRHPCLRVVWKPDVSRLDASSQPSLARYMEKYYTEHAHAFENRDMAYKACLLDLIGHKNPKFRLLELGSSCHCSSDSFMDSLHGQSDFPRCQNWHAGSFDQSNNLTVSQDRDSSNSEKLMAKDASYDVLLMTNRASSTRYWKANSTVLAELLGGRGLYIGPEDPMTSRGLELAGYSILRLPGNTILALPPKISEHLYARDMLLVDSSANGGTLSNHLATHFRDLGFPSVGRCTLDNIHAANITKKTTVVALLETEHSFLPSMTTREMDALKVITNQTDHLLWMNGAGMIRGDKPDLTLANGLSRALMLEQPALRFAVLDAGDCVNISPAECKILCKHVVNVLEETDTPADKEFVYEAGLVHISRFVPDDGINNVWNQRRGRKPRTMTLEKASPARLAITKPGAMDTIFFQQESEPESHPPPGYVDVDVRAVSLNAKDVYVLSGKTETSTGTLALEFAGVVKTVGSGVSVLQPGDRVLVLAPNSFRTTERVPVWACEKLLDTESFEVMATLPVVYATALYALNDRANMRKGESVLIHSGAGAFGIAAITLAQSMGAVIYATVSTDEKKDYLVNELGVQRENIFQSRDTSFVEGIMKATAGRGVDIVLNSLTGDLLHASWRCCAKFGRFVEIGKRDIIDAGKLDMDVFLRSVTFTAFDMSELYYHEDAYYQSMWNSKLKEVVQLFRSGSFRAAPIRIFDVSEITSAYRYFSNRSRIGKVVVSLTNGSSPIQVVPATYAATFSPEKSYLLIGCLGGLGRSLSKWMFQRGARHFTFIGRSGCDKASARELVDVLETSGAVVQVTRGDVSDKNDVMKAIAASPKPIGGVVQAAMGLHEALFITMTNEAWKTGIQPKWRGTWNIHEALEGKDSELDFFLLTSSISGTVGTATESNYCAANGFLDSFARHRRSLGKPVSSLGLGMISEVGYLHENPEIEALLLRKGIQPLNEEELLQVIDLAIAGPACAAGMSYDTLAASHILTGLEPNGIRELMKKGFDVNNGTMQDPRSGILATALATRDETVEIDVANLETAWSKDLSPALVKVFASEAASAATLSEAILVVVKRRFSNLVLMPIDKVDGERPLALYGMDSMIAAEFRTWFHATFKVDIPFLEFLSASNSLTSLAVFVEQAL